MSELYDRIVDLCKRKGERPAVVCKAAGVSASLPTDIKMGRKKGMSLTTAGKLAAYLGVSVDEILGVDESTTLVAQQAEPQKPAFVQNYEILDPIDKAKAEAYISGLLAQDKYNGGN